MGYSNERQKITKKHFYYLIRVLPNLFERAQRDSIQHPFAPMNLRFILFCAVLFILSVSASARTSSTPQHLFTSTHPAMGTTYSLFVYADDEAHAKRLSDEVWEEIDRIEELLSNYRETSELSRINHLAAAAPVTTDPETFRFLSEAQEWSRVSDGAFDLTVGKLMRAWGFFRSAGHVPTDVELANVRQETGWEKMQLDPQARSVRFLAPGLELDPGGIGKGFAIDAAAALLRRDGVRSALLSAGSSTLYAIGAPPHRTGWRVVVPDPVVGNPPLSVIFLRDESVSSANCTEKNFTLNGHLYCHIMDPSTLRPVEGMLRVSVIHPSATASDALSNVVFVKRPEESLKVLAKHAPQSRAILVSGDSSHPTCTVFRWTVKLSPRCDTTAKRTVR
jgi:FAD:protein FMN transferase